MKRKYQTPNSGEYIDLDNLELEARLDYDLQNTKKHSGESKMFPSTERNQYSRYRPTYTNMNKSSYRVPPTPEIKSLSTSSSRKVDMKQKSNFSDPRKIDLNLKNSDQFASESSKKLSLNEAKWKSYKPTTIGPIDYQSRYKFPKSKNTFLNTKEQNSTDYINWECKYAIGGRTPSPKIYPGEKKRIESDRLRFQHVTAYKLVSDGERGTPRLKADNCKFTYFYDKKEKDNLSKHSTFYSTKNEKTIKDYRHGNLPAPMPKRLHVDETEKLLQQFRQTSQFYRTRIKEIQTKAKRKFEKVLFDYKVDLLKNGGKKYL